VGRRAGVVGGVGGAAARPPGLAGRGLGAADAVVVDGRTVTLALDGDGTIDQVRVITAVGADCSTDVNGDAVTDLADLLSVLAAFGGYERFADVDRSGFVDLDDLLAVLGAFGGECG